MDKSSKMICFYFSITGEADSGILPAVMGRAYAVHSAATIRLALRRRRLGPIAERFPRLVRHLRPVQSVGETIRIGGGRQALRVRAHGLAEVSEVADEAEI